MHSQLGPSVKALVIANNDAELAVKEQVEKKMESCPFNANASSVVREKTCFVSNNSENNGTSDGNGMGFEIPKTNITACLAPDCIDRMVSQNQIFDPSMNSEVSAHSLMTKCIQQGLKEGKDSWKKRKEALEEVESVCIQYKGLISTESNCFKDLVTLIRALQSRLSDLQSNLKPLAARNIALILGSVDSSAQAKLGKIVYGPLISAAMNDNKKIMRDASLSALKEGTMKLELEGGGVNHLSMDPFMHACVIELIETGQKVRIIVNLFFTI